MSYSPTKAGGGHSMQYAAVALVVLGWIIGAAFQLWFLLGAIALLLIISLVFSLSHGFTLWDTILIVMVAQAILQVSYFLGLLSRGIFSFAQRKLTIFSRAEAEHLRKPQDS
jgi:hypothetical protein